MELGVNIVIAGKKNYLVHKSSMLVKVNVSIICNLLTIANYYIGLSIITAGGGGPFEASFSLWSKPFCRSL